MHASSDSRSTSRPDGPATTVTVRTESTGRRGRALYQSPSTGSGARLRALGSRRSSPASTQMVTRSTHHLNGSRALASRSRTTRRITATRTRRAGEVRPRIAILADRGFGLRARRGVRPTGVTTNPNEHSRLPHHGAGLSSHKTDRLDPRNPMRLSTRGGREPVVARRARQWGTPRCQARRIDTSRI